jgi:hypothetical protein
MFCLSVTTTTQTWGGLFEVIMKGRPSVNVTPAFVLSKTFASKTVVVV